MIELLAPAGGPESIEAAVRCGADAVYVGGENFSARANAHNFSYDELCSAVKYCHLHNVKVHQAINTLMFDNETDMLIKTVKQSASAGVDALIVQDLGVARLIKSIVTDMPLHASTQMSVHTKSGALFAKELGFSRVVVARELSLSEIADVCSAGIEVEAFVHGALCMCVSGQCYMSSMIGSRSANRGLCAQACRLPFSAIQGENRYDLSLKDMSLINHISELAKAGVCSLKIEGRMKRPEYVASAVTACRLAIDGKEYDVDTLKSVFSRSGFTDGYLTGKTGQVMFGIRQKEDVVSAESVFPQLRELYRKESKCRTVDFSVVMKHNVPVEIIAESENITVRTYGQIPEKANNTPTTFNTFEKQLSKLGDTVFSMGRLNCDIDDGLVIPVSQINSMRRELAMKLEERIIADNTRNYAVNDIEPEHIRSSHKSVNEVRAKVRNVEQAEVCLENEYVCKVILPVDECIKIAYDKKIIPSLQRFVTDENVLEQKLVKIKEKGFKEVYCQNVAHIYLARKYGLEMHCGAFINVTNSYTLNVLSELGVKDAVVSFEMKLSQIERLSDILMFGIVAYGRIPLMLTRNCPVKQAVGGCKHCTGRITDRTGRSFPVVCDRVCSEILNSDVLTLSDRQNEIKGASFIELDFTNESADKVKDVVCQFRNKIKTDDKDFTRGLYYRGII